MLVRSDPSPPLKPYQPQQYPTPRAATKLAEHSAPNFIRRVGLPTVQPRGPINTQK
jgi:hypothetical protein